MKLTIDNLHGSGPIDYTAWLDGTFAPRIERVLNQPAKLRLSLVSNPAGFVVPLIHARITLAKASGAFLFTGYLIQAPEIVYLGWGEQSAVYRYELVAESDEVLLDQKVLPNRAPFVARTAGSALRQLVQDLLPGAFDTRAVQELDSVAAYEVNPQKRFSYHAGELALASRASYMAMNGALSLAPVGMNSYALNESDLNFSPAGLRLTQGDTVINDVTVIGANEPQAYVRDYFVGDGLSTRFYLSQTPFAQSKPALIDEQFAGTAIDPTTWMVSDPTAAISVAAQALQVSGGTGQDGQTTVSFIEQIELGGALELQHGDISFAGASNGIIGGLYAGSVSVPGCLAGFRVSPNGAGSNIQAVINGSATGPVVTTTSGHRYVLTTYIYSREVYRTGETYHSSAHPTGDGLGDTAVTADARLVLEVQDINPAVPATIVAAPTVLYDDVIVDAAGFCTYALVNAINMQCSIAFPYATRISLAEVRSALPSAGYVTQIVGSISDGAQCSVASSTTLDFYPHYVPPLNALIVASYRGSGRAVAEVVNSASMAALANGSDNGSRGVVQTMKIPSARTQSDCENAALAILDDAEGSAWTGSYETWSDFLPGSAADVFPGDALTVDVPSQNAAFIAIVRIVAVDLIDSANDRAMYVIEFATDLASPLGYQEGESTTVVPLQETPPALSTTQVGAYYLANLTDAQITQVSSTTVQVDAGVAPGNGLAIEARAHDFGWGPSNDRNLLGRFTTQTFSLPRLARTQGYFLRLYDTSSPGRYSRYSAALHVDYPL
ncbi:MAG: hypothetical protein WA485_14390 [Candidatus Sulfotelmatobacter sp.]